MKKTMIMASAVIISLLASFTIENQNMLFSAEKNLAKKGYLGVSVRELDRHLKKELEADFGVVITSIEYDSPADEYGLMEDDVIQRVNDIKIRRPSTLTRIIRKLEPGEKVKIVVIRDGREKTIAVEIGRLKSSKSYAFSVGPNVLKWYGGGGYLGVQLQELNKDLAPYFGVKENEGALILEVEEDSPAEDVDLKAGDVILKVDGESISDPEDVQDIISELEEDDKIEIEIIRQNRKKTVEVTLAKRDGYHNFFISPGRKIRELRYRSTPKKSIDFYLKGFETNRDKKLRQIIIDQKKSSSSRAI